MNSVNFDYKLVAADNFDDLLTRHGMVAETESALSLVMSKGRSLIQARGGEGKSTLANRLVAQAIADQGQGLFLRSLDWANVLSTSTGGSNAASELAILIGQHSIASTKDALIVIDGVNEVSRDLSERVIEAADLVAARNPRWSFVLTDRLHRRDLALSDWALFTLTQVSPGLVRQLVPGSSAGVTTAILQNPFYLDRATQGNLGSATRASQHEEYLRIHSSVEGDDLASLGAFAFAQYSERATRSIDAR
jgi:hypothetical protein